MVCVVVSVDCRLPEWQTVKGVWEFSGSMTHSSGPPGLFLLAEIIGMAHGEKFVGDECMEGESQPRSDPPPPSPLKLKRNRREPVSE